VTFIETVPEDQATGAVAAMYEQDRETFGTLPNFTRALSLRPDAYAAWRGLNGAIKSTMDLRRYELVTVAAARRLRSTYCVLAHGTVLMDKFLEPDVLQAVVADHRTAGLDDVDVAVMDLADKVVQDATSVEEGDVERLRKLGLTDEEITDVVLAAAARSFFSKTLDALGVRPDSTYSRLDAELRGTLTVGRPIDGDA
jgi:uncharacterized peroxidase-related enzyme